MPKARIDLNRPTAKECAAHTGYSISSMKRLCCRWCDESMLNALRYGCGAIWQDDGGCDPWGTLKNIKAKRHAKS